MIKLYEPNFDTTVEVVQFKGYNVPDVMELCGTKCFVDGSLPKPDRIHIVTTEGKQTAKIGDYILKTIFGGLSILEKEAFEPYFNEKKKK